MKTEIILDRINQRLDNTPDSKCKEDIRLLITSIVSFTNEQDPRIMDPETDQDEIGKLLFKLVVNVGAEGGIAQLRKSTADQFKRKFDKLTVLWPILKYYSNTYDGTEDVKFEEIKNELPSGEKNLLNGSEE